MKNQVFFRPFFLFFLLLIIAAPLPAQVSETSSESEAQQSDSGVLDGLLKTLGDAAQDSLEQEIEEFIGTYEGRIGEVKLLERRGNAIVLQVDYEDVKRRDGVYVQGDVLRWGQPLEGFSSTLSPIEDKKGAVILKIGRDSQADATGWDTGSEEVMSDQILLYLVRKTDPDRPFGSLVYDFQKEWTDSSGIESAEAQAAGPADSEDAIELAEDETGETTQADTAGPKPVETGAVLRPVQTAEVGQTASGKVAQSGDTARKPNLPARKISIPLVTQYNFFAHASKAAWKSAAGQLPFPGSDSDNRGFARTLKSGTIYPDNKAANLLQTHPQWVDGGWIQGRFPVMKLGNNVMFKSTGALLKGAESSDGVVMTVFVVSADNKSRRVLRKRITKRQYTPLEADLSAWAGKPVRIVLRAQAGQSSAQDWAVWVNPRLVSQ